MAVAGASGYAGGEAVRLLAQHPSLRLGALCAHSSAGRPVREVLGHLDLPGSLTFEDTTVDNLRGHDAVILGLPHGTSAPLASALRAADPGVIIVDLGADFRLDDPAAWERYYGGEHAGTWTYGIPELPLADGRTQRNLLQATRQIAAPGCNASAVTFAALPLVRAGLVDPTSLSAVLAVGYSGAGKVAKPHLLYAEAADSASAYSAGGTHRHIPEILQNLDRATGIPRAQMALAFTPVLVPMSRGILAVLTARLNERGRVAGADAVGEAMEATWGSEPFVRLYEGGTQPATANARGANAVHLGWTHDPVSATVTVTCAIDNLVKGTAGAALQSLNLALGLDESTGLPTAGLRP